MKMKITVFVSSLAACLFAVCAQAAPVSIDGLLGSEWTGVTPKSVLYNPSITPAQTGNFGSPTNENELTAYDIYTRGDDDYLYVGIQTVGSNYPGGVNGANLYFSTTLSSSRIGFEVTNNRAFYPGGAGGYFPYTSTLNDIHHVMTPYANPSTPMVLEVAFPWHVFTQNSLGVNDGAVTPVYTPLATTGVRLNLSQSFGYSVAGGETFYGTERLGVVTTPVPEPSAIALSVVGFACLVGLRRYKRCR